MTSGPAQRRVHASRDAVALIDEGLLAAILSVLRDAPAGLSEHALITTLRRRAVEPFDGAALREPLSLFRTHFLLFHCLYRLRDRLAAAGEWLHVDCLDIRIDVAGPAVACAVAGADPRHPVHHDPVRAYYLDLSRLDRVDAAAVEAMLGGFWRRLRADERRQQALALLGLEDPADDTAVQRRYRSLVQRHHPDRGGDATLLQQLNEARWVLLAGRGGPRGSRPA